MNAVYPMDSTPEEIYAVESGKNIKLRFNNGTDIIERYLDIVGKDGTSNTVIYSVRKVTYRNAVVEGVSNANLIENRFMYTTSTVNGEIFRILRILRRNGYVITHPKKSNMNQRIDVNTHNGYSHL